ncbi:MAG: hypothetical protein IPN38_18055, partial [Flavobacteriales bacterium]|nr:hypothetical protein [Flavobacteriales bacterium]
SPFGVLQSRTALVQRDGDVVATDGVSPVLFSLSAGSYHMAIRHRNHFGVMTENPVTLSVTTSSLDFTSAAFGTYGTEAQKTVGAVRALGPGNVQRDATLKYIGASNDHVPILTAVGGTTPNNTAPGYLAADVNMDGL